MTHTVDTGDPNGTAIPTPSATGTNSSKSISPEAAAVLVAVIVPAVVIAIVVFCFFQIQKHWKMRQAEEAAALKMGASVDPRIQSEDVQLYLQNKVELSAERTGFGMQAEEEVYELMARDQFPELPEEGFRQHMPSLEELHELRGEDHARELDASPNQQDHAKYSFEEPSFNELNVSVLRLNELAYNYSLTRVHISGVHVHLLAKNLNWKTV